MSLRFFAHSKSIVNKAERDAENLASILTNNQEDYIDTYNKLYTKNLESALKDFDELLKVPKNLQIHKQILKKSKKEARRTADSLSTNMDDYEEIYEKSLSQNLEQNQTNFRDVLDHASKLHEISSKLHEIILEFKQPTNKRMFITITPDDKKVYLMKLSAKVSTCTSWRK